MFPCVQALQYVRWQMVCNEIRQRSGGLLCTQQHFGWPHQISLQGFLKSWQPCIRHLKSIQSPTNQFKSKVGYVNKGNLPSQLLKEDLMNSTHLSLRFVCRMKTFRFSVAGTILMMALCREVHVYEYIPSLRQTDLCHYYEHYYDAACTLGAYHPLLYEKVLVHKMNVAPEQDLKKKGRITVPGFSTVDCGP